MSGVYLFGGMLLLLLVAIVWAAIRAGADTGAALEPGERRDAAIEALRDLELEFRTGKLTEEEYRAIRAPLERAAIEARNAASSVACVACGAALEGDEAYCPRCGRGRGARSG